MSSPNLPALFQPGGLSAAHQSRAIEKRLAALKTDTTLDLAQVRAIEAVEIAKVEALEATGHIGLVSTASLAQHRRFLIESDPDAVAAFDHIAGITIAAIGGRVEMLNRRLG
jgi:aryl-alcohol dehydrogenase-like predicted oxidoreductase